MRRCGSAAERATFSQLNEAANEREGAHSRTPKEFHCARCVCESVSRHEIRSIRSRTCFHSACSPASISCLRFHSPYACRFIRLTTMTSSRVYTFRVFLLLIRYRWSPRLALAAAAGASAAINKMPKLNEWTAEPQWNIQIVNRRRGKTPQRKAVARLSCARPAISERCESQ